MEDLIHDFLLASLFGSDYRKFKNDPINIAIDRAYLDFCRTIRTANNPNISNLDVSKNTAKEVINRSINELLLESKDYNQWHKKLCKALVKKGIGYTYGQAQKWINMTMKYLVVLDYKTDNISIRDFASQLHATIDTDIINKLKDLEIIDNKSTYTPWSSNKLAINYDELQKKIRNSDKIKPNPFEWEFSAWNSMN